MPKKRGGWGGDYRDIFPKSTPRRVENGIKTKNERGAIGESWWARRWVGVLESFGMGNRLTRGRSYARKGQVVSIELAAGEVKAAVQGSSPRPYKVEIKLTPLSAAAWDKVSSAMAGQAIFAARLLAGEMPENIEEAFAAAGVSLFPRSEAELITDCSCPDWSNPCKHIAAVYYILAERFEEDPFLIFKLRGRSKEELIAALREMWAASLPLPADARSQAASLHPENAAQPEGDVEEEEQARPLEASLGRFWEARPELENFVAHPVPPQIENALLKRLGEPPFKLGNQDVSTMLAKAYQVASAAALRKAREG